MIYNLPVVVLDLHGVLVNTALIKENYELFLVEQYQRFRVPKELAQKFHEKGLKQFTDTMLEIGKEGLIDGDFLSAMAVVDEDWNRLMRQPVEIDGSGRSQLEKVIESRAVEKGAGRIRNALFPDAQAFLRSWKEQKDHWHLVIASNSHGAHISGVIEGFSQQLAKKIPIIGWERIKCLKSHPSYFQRLRTILAESFPDERLFMIGNSTEEMVGANLKDIIPILILRDRNVSSEALKVARKVFPSLDGVWTFIKQETYSR